MPLKGHYNSKTNQLQSAAPWGNSYIDDELKAVIYKDWKVVADDFVPPVSEPTKQEKLTSLDADYQPQFNSLAQALGVATLAGDQTMIDSIKSDYATLKAEYTTKMEAINNE